MSISDNVKSLLAELPPGVTLIAAVKGRTVREIMEAIEAGITTVGENYLQEAHDHFSSIGKKINWHFIGSLQQNKVKSAAQIFDMVETVDSVALATALSRYASRIGKVLQVLVEVNSGEEPQKSGVRPEKTESLLRNISALENIRVVGLMTMGPRFGNPEDSRPYFAVTRRLSEDISSLRLPGVSMDCLSMGMTNTYHIAIQEGANLIRIGNKIFGERA